MNDPSAGGERERKGFKHASVLTMTRISSFLNSSCGLQRYELDLVLPFISHRSPSFHHIQLPRVGTPQCSFCQQLSTHVFASWVFFHVWVHWTEPLFTCHTQHQWLVLVTWSHWSEKCQSSVLKRENYWICMLLLLYDKTEGKSTNGRITLECTCDLNKNCCCVLP